MIDPKQYQFLLNGEIKNRGTLAQHMDVRQYAIEEPAPNLLPKKLNSFKFLFDNCFKSNLTIIKIRQQDCPIPSTDFRLLQLVKRVLPPEILLHVYLEAIPKEYTLELNSTFNCSPITVLNTQELIVNNLTFEVNPYNTSPPCNEQ